MWENMVSKPSLSDAYNGSHGSYTKGVARLCGLELCDGFNVVEGYIVCVHLILKEQQPLSIDGFARATSMSGWKNDIF